MYKPKISIVVPVYNVEKYLKRCIDSILAQTFKEFELIIINDGASDNSSKILDEYSKIDERIKVIHKKNEGCSAARNDGIKLSKAEYIGFVDGDDYIEPKMYEKLYNQIKKNENVDMIECGVKINNLLTKEKEIILPKVYSSAVWSKLFKLKIIKKYNIYFPMNTYMGEDLAFIEKYVFVSKDIFYVKEALYNYHLNEGSVSINFKKRIEIYKSLDDIIKFKKNYNIKGKNKIIKKRILDYGFEYAIDALKKYRSYCNINLEYYAIFLYYNSLKYYKFISLKNVIYLFKVMSKAYIEVRFVKKYERKN
ncbi:MAG: glycosyltransferase family 2 protein [Cetobacterium sp.]